MLESQFQAFLKGRLKAEFPDCVILKNDPTYLQGIPDLTVLWGKQWAALECKRDGRAVLQPNQRYFIDKLNSMGFAAVVYPDNAEEVIDAMAKYFFWEEHTDEVS